MTAAVQPMLVWLANLGQPRRPAGARESTAEEVFKDPVIAARQLSGMVDGQIKPSDLTNLRDVHCFAQRFVYSVIYESPAPDPSHINELAHSSHGFLQLLRDGAHGGWQAKTTWVSATVAAELARRLIAEIGELKLDRLKVCARTECTLVFYDWSRSRTQLWHAENPCGWRSRQTRHRNTKGSTHNSAI